jgi:quercetin 2,3-dioxygenase
LEVLILNHKILVIKKLGNHWEASDPFLFCVHHQDAYPKGNEQLGPAASLMGRQMGSDFHSKDGWNMYHGEEVPGFPEHPHRGFETVTIVLEGFVDHFDSTGAAGRFGAGDVQWMTAGKGARHSEMFPLLHQDKKNPLELFQIWMNLPRKDKFVDPHYKMLWKEDIPKLVIEENNKKSTITLIAGTYNDSKSLDPSPNSWANDSNHHVNIQLINCEAGATLTLPQVSETLNRTLYFYSGETISIDGTTITTSHSVKLNGNESITIINGNQDSALLLLEGEPINEPVYSHGPFVMTTREEIIQAFEEYEATHFGGWKWGRPDPVHPRDKGRFAIYSDGTVDERD